MMKQEQQVCCLELAIKLKALGVKQDSQWWWADTRKSWKPCNYINGHEFVPFENNNGAGEIELVYGYEEAVRASSGYNESIPIAAFSGGELGEKLPFDIGTTKVGEDDWYCFQYDSEDGDTIWHELDENFSPEGFNAVTEADSRAKMFIYLFENKLITL